jgi:hypothetical protein
MCNRDLRQEPYEGEGCDYCGRARKVEGENCEGQNVESVAKGGDDLRAEERPGDPRSSAPTLRSVLTPRVTGR